MNADIRTVILFFILCIGLARTWLPAICMLLWKSVRKSASMHMNMQHFSVFFICAICMNLAADCHMLAGFKNMYLERDTEQMETKKTFIFVFFFLFCLKQGHGMCWWPIQTKRHKHKLNMNVSLLIIKPSLKSSDSFSGLCRCGRSRFNWQLPPVPA